MCKDRAADPSSGVPETVLKHRTPATIRAPFAKYVHAVEVPAGMSLVFLSGQLGIGPDETVPEGAEAQSVRCFENIAAVLADLGADFSALVRLNAFVTHRDHLAGYMAARDRFVADPPPASTLMIVGGFTREAFVVEVEAIAAVA